MATSPLPLILAILTTVTAGCLADAGLDRLTDDPALTEDAARWAVDALPFGTGHDHQDPTHHRDLSTDNFHVLSWNPLETEYHSAVSGSYYCGERAILDDRTITFTHSYSSDVAFVGVDVTNPADPVVVSEFVLPNDQVYDVTVTPDARYVALAVNLDRSHVGPDEGAGGGVPALPTQAGVTRSGGCDEGRATTTTTDDTPYPTGVVLVDVSDPASPVVTDFAPQPRHTHSIFSTIVDGRTFVLASSLNTAHAAAYFGFYEVVDGDLQLKYLHRPLPSSLETTPITNGHVDGTIQKHPFTNRTLAYLADWNGGMVVLDITDWDDVQEVSTWRTYRLNDPQDDSGSVHQALPLEELWDGRHITLTGQEVVRRPSGTPSGVINILDTTDPANPRWLGGWTLPVDAPWDFSLQWSTHYPIVVDRTMFVPMYHGGLWAVDVADPTAPRTIGVFIPANEAPSLAVQGRFSASPLVLEAVTLPDGRIGVFDADSGLYVVEFDATRPAPAIKEWEVLEPWTA